ncbi:hypothetical protein SEMRO_603_G174050.1 [Seminavis robusta]|uniref:Uncharacterized protein n=1 Tax=Seminavis robusta TaxID=568900 RepID=A0A9N8HKA9_9STRA|nr:hypothetical protein SEMRO_603_G174050.1 [Seminavis robusta]|eukprot:Sro603_g174050.1 n/a (531) ;mRNA; f:53981-55674
MPASVDDSIIPPPVDGKMYSRHECIQVIELAPKTVAKATVIDGIIGMSYIPVKKASLYRMMKRWREHKNAGGTLESFPKYDWNNFGRPSLLSTNDLKEVAQELSARPGKTICLEELKEKMISRKKEKIEASGKILLSESTATPCKDTLRSYGTHLRLTGGVSCPSSSIKKTRTRATAETSIRSSAAFIAVVAISHLTITGDINEHPDVTKFLRYAPELERLVYEKVSSFFGGVPLFPIKARYLISSDDTTEWTMNGLNTDNTNEVFFTAISSYHTDTGKRSQYNTGPAPAVTGGIRVKMTALMSAAGIFGPLCVSVLGLNERELPKDSCESGAVIIKVRGLSIGGGGVTVGSNQCGYIMLVRNDGNKDTEKVKCQLFTKHCLLPFIETLRKEDPGGHWTPGLPIPDSLQAMVWCDGELSQLATMVDPVLLKQFKDLSIGTNKQSAARTATEQPCDICSIFKDLKIANKATTLKDTLPEAHHFKDIVVGSLALANRKYGFKLKQSKHDALVDFGFGVSKFQWYATHLQGRD